MKKIFILILIFALLFSLTVLSAYAIDEGQNPDTGADIPQTDTVEDGVEIGSENAEDRSGEAEKNPFSILYGEIIKNSDKILSALTFIGSLILAFTYKKGLLPIVKGSLSTLGGAVTKLKEETEGHMENTLKYALAVKEKLDSAEKLFTSLAERLDTLAEELKDVSANEQKNRKFREIMNAQVDMLYEIFMSSSLPQYQKDSVGEKISEMKKNILGDGTND